jgi:hypothetical protein
MLHCLSTTMCLGTTKRKEQAVEGFFVLGHGRPLACGCLLDMTPSLIARHGSDDTQAWVHRDVTKWRLCLIARANDKGGP